MIKVGWEGPQSAVHSLAIVNQKLCMEITKYKDINLTIIPSEQENKEIEIQNKDIMYWIRHQWPPNFDPPTQGKWVMFQPWEFGSIPGAWLAHILYEIDEVWVYSDFNRQTYIKSGIPENKVFVIPLGIDPNLYTPNGNKLLLNTKKTYKYLFVGGTIWRKGIDILLNTYTSMFSKSDDVCLVIKDFGVNSFYQGINYQKKIEEIMQSPNSPEIIYLNQELTPNEIASLYRSCDCLVHPYRGEGFGLPIIEAMACGLPVIVPDKGPATEFATSDTAFFVNSNYVHPEGIFFGHDYEPMSKPQVIVVDQIHLMSTMKKLYQNPALGRSVGKRASESILQNYKWKNSAETVLKHIRHQSKGTPVRFHKRAWIQEGHRAFEESNWHHAAYCLKKALENKCDQELVHYQLGISLTHLKNYNEGMTHLILAKQLLTPDQSSLTFNVAKFLGICMYNLKRFKDARMYLLEAQSVHADLEVSELILSIDQLAELYKLPPSVNQNISSDSIYQTLSEAFSESSDELRRRNKKWVDLFLSNERVLEIGNQHSMFLELFNEKGILTEYLELEPEELTMSQKNELANYSSYDGIILSHVIERFSSNLLIDLLIKCLHALRPGGRIVIISPNITHPQVQANFWLNITHLRPYPPELIVKSLELLGLTIAESGNEETQQDYFVVAKKQAMRMLWESPLLNTSGYATGSRNIIEGLRPYPYCVNIIIREGDSNSLLHNASTVQYLNSLAHNKTNDPHVHIQNIPGEIFTSPKAPISIARTMFETDRIPEKWIVKCNQFQEIWVPSAFNLETFKNSGIPSEKLYMIPEPIDPNIFQPIPAKQASLGLPLKKFVFLSVGIWGIHKGSGWGLRKGWDVLLQAYIEEFTSREDVSLLLKVFTFEAKDAVKDIEIFLQYSSRSLADSPHIAVINTPSISESDMLRLYANASAFVMPTRGEGWGRPFMEAMSMEIPVIGTNWGGNLSFMNEANSYLIDIDGLEKVSNYIPFEQVRGHYWAKPSLQSTRKKMREVYENYALAQKKAKIGRKEIEENFSNEVIAKKIHERIRILTEKYL